MITVVESERTLRGLGVREDRRSRMERRTMRPVGVPCPLSLLKHDLVPLHNSLPTIARPRQSHRARAHSTRSGRESNRSVEGGCKTTQTQIEFDDSHLLHLHTDTPIPQINVPSSSLRVRASRVPGSADPCPGAGEPGALREAASRPGPRPERVPSSCEGWRLRPLGRPSLRPRGRRGNPTPPWLSQGLPLLRVPGLRRQRDADWPSRVPPAENPTRRPAA